MADVSSESAPVNLPLGFHEAKLDDKGRLKLPSDFQQFFTGLGASEFFITSLDGSIAQLYTLQIWRQVAAFLKECPDEPEKAADALFNGNDLGGKAEMDAQGRVLVPAKLRRELNLENQTVRLNASETRVDILSDDMYAALRKRARESAQQKVLDLRKVGLKW